MIFNVYCGCKGTKNYGTFVSMIKVHLPLLFIVINTTLFAQTRFPVVEVASAPVATYKIGPCEPSIAIHYNSPDTLVIGTVLNGYHYSHDGGKHWQTETLKSPYGVWGDPVVISDTNGHFHYFHLSDPTGKNWRSDSILDRIVCQTSTDGGVNWNDGSYMGLNYPKQQDKEWATLDPETNTLYVTWTQFDKYKSPKPEDESHIMFSKSTDGGKTWAKAKQISTIGGGCMDDRFTAEGAVPTVGTDGSIHVVWSRHDTLWLSSSEDGGSNFSSEHAIAPHRNGWRMAIPGVPRANGFPIIVTDRSKGKRHGNLYVNWAEQIDGATDVYFMRSNDDGKTWSKPSKVSNDTTNTHRFFTWMAIDPDDGTLYVVYYDRRHYEDAQTDVYLSWSNDGGKTWKESRISEKPFTPVQDFFFGDYNHIDVRHGIVRPVWTAMEQENGQLKIYTSLINTKDLE